jgi:Ca-activated chloride channel family protein
MADFHTRLDQMVSFIQMMKVEIDEQLMKSIAKKTDGRYFRATSNNKLAEIYGEINKLETTEIEELKFMTMMRSTDLLFGLQALLAEIGLRNTIYRVLFKVKSVEALSDFHLAQLLINFNGSLLK